MPSLPVMRYWGIDLHLSRVLDADHRAVYDDSGINYLYTHVRLAVRCVIHWDLTKPIPLPGGEIGPPVRSRDPAAGRPAETHPGIRPQSAGIARAFAELRRQLLVPQGPLDVFVGDEVILQAPGFYTTAGGERKRFAIDCNAGPHPVNFKIVSVVGTKSIIADFAIECWIREDAGTVPTPPTLISHRWAMAESIDEQYLSTRRISGRLVFRTDFLAHRALTPLARADLRPDDFRYLQRVLHPVPPRYRRAKVDVEQTQDGTGILYTVIDREVPWPCANGYGVRRVTGEMTQGFDHLTAFNPQVTRRWSVTAFGFPRVGSLRLIKALALIYSTSSTAARSEVYKAMTAAGGFGGSSFTTRPGFRPFEALDVRLAYDSDGGPTASFVWTVTAGKVFSVTPIGAGIDAFSKLVFLDENIWPEDAGTPSHPRVTLAHRMPRAADIGDNRAYTQISLVAQVLNNPITAEQPTPSEPGVGVRGITS